MEVGNIVRPSTGLVERFKGLGTSTLGDVLDDLNLQGVINIRPVCPGFRFVGVAFTVKEVTGIHGSFKKEDFSPVGEIIDLAEKGDVLIFDNGGAQVSTWGGVASAAAQARGVAGIVVDGAVRDVDEISEFRFPVFARHVVPTTGKLRIKVVSANTVVQMDGVRVRPGDVIVGDGTGVVCIPVEFAKEVAATAERYDQQDKQAIEEVRKSLSFMQASRKFPKL